MIKKVSLAQGNIQYVCDICGHAESVPMPFCGVTPIPQKATVHVGDRVWMWWHWGRYIRRGLYAVRSMRYAGPGYDGHVRGRQLPLHTLIIEVAQKGDGTPWTQGSSSYMGTELSYPDFLLWQEGDEEKLRAAGLLQRLTAWERFKKRLGVTVPSIKRP